MKRIAIPLLVSTVIVVAVVITLARNKEKLDVANTPVDRTRIPVAVSVDSVKLQAFDVPVLYPATTQPYDVAKIYTQASGMIASLHIQLGQQVSKGEVLGRLDSKILAINLEDAQQELKLADINRNKVLDDYNRAKDLYENKAGLEVNMLTAKNNYDNAVINHENVKNKISLIHQQLNNNAIIAPLSGTISANGVKQGEFVNPGTPIASISDINSLKATVYVDQLLAYQLKQGQKAVISSQVFGQETFTGNIIYISPVADENHNYQIDLLVSNKKNTTLKGGTDVQVSFNTLLEKDVLQITKTAVLTDGPEPYVYVVFNGQAKVRKIVTGGSKNDKIEVVSGLRAQDVVVTAGQINLRDGSNVSIIKN